MILEILVYRRKKNTAQGRSVAAFMKAAGQLLTFVLSSSCNILEVLYWNTASFSSDVWKFCHLCQSPRSVEC
jgi:hypothetical protein